MTDSDHPTTAARNDVVSILRDRPSSARAGGYQVPLARLYERFDAIAKGRAPADGADLHRLILDRLAANRKLAEGAGWTACAFERDGGSGRIRLIGVAPSAEASSVVPDWTEGVAAEARESAARAPRPVPPRPASDERRPGPRIVRG
jgi:hypothetical protein